MFEHEYFHFGVIASGIQFNNVENLYHFRDFYSFYDINVSLTVKLHENNQRILHPYSGIVIIADRFPELRRESSRNDCEQNALAVALAGRLSTVG